MALRSTIVDPRIENRNSFDDTSLDCDPDDYEVLIEDELVGTTTVREISRLRCEEILANLFESPPEDMEDLLRSIAKAIAVRDYLHELGEDPDAPSLG